MTHCSPTSRGLGAPLACGLGALLAMSSLLACGTDAPVALDPGSVAVFQQQVRSLPFDLRPLSTEPVPQPFIIEPVLPTVGTIINQQAAIRLGKALFWDIQAGSDGQVACAACHASFGSDARRFNTLYPGLDEIFDSGGVTGPGQLFTPTLISNDDIVGAQGVAHGQFVRINPDPHIAADDCTPIADPLFGAERQVEFRQAPMIYGAVFLRQLFWAGEASDEWNGTTIWGFRGNNLGPTFIHLGNSALASQAVGPVANSTEMRCVGRPLLGPTALARKMMAPPPLQLQRPSPGRSALGPAPPPFSPSPTGRVGALPPPQVLGLLTFVGRGNCATCHAGPMLSDASTSFFLANGALNRDGGDQGFHNIGLLEDAIDLGRGDVGPGGVR